MTPDAGTARRHPFGEGDFEERAVVVTAGGGAICGAVGRLLGSLRAKVALWDIDGGAAAAVATEINRAGGHAVGCACDCGDRESVSRALDRTVAEIGHPKFLVNGAGGSRPQTTTSDSLPFFDIPPNEVSETVRLNYLSTIVTSQAFVKSLFGDVEHGGSDRPRGRETAAAIVNIASVAGLQPLSRATTYSDSKAAVGSFTRWLAVHLAREYDSTVRVNAVAPGFVLTKQNQFLLIDESTGEPTDRGRQVLSAVPMARYGQPEEIAEVVAWLLSGSARFVTGAVIPVDGGFIADSGV